MLSEKNPAYFTTIRKLRIEEQQVILIGDQDATQLRMRF
jgi:hypothetical protein